MQNDLDPLLVNAVVAVVFVDRRLLWEARLQLLWDSVGQQYAFRLALLQLAERRLAVEYLSDLLRCDICEDEVVWLPPVVGGDLLPHVVDSHVVVERHVEWEVAVVLTDVILHHEATNLNLFRADDRHGNVAERIKGDADAVALRAGKL